MTVKFRILLWKNVRTEKRMLRHLSAEILAIILLGILIIANPSRSLRRFSPTKEEKSSVKFFDSDALSDLDILKGAFDEDEEFPSSLAYEPELPYAKKIAEAVATTFGLKATTNYIPNKFLAKLIFNDHEGEGMPKNLTVRIRFPGKFRTYKSSRVHSNLWLSRCTGCLTNSFDDTLHEIQTDLYIREGFLQLQHETFKHWYTNLEGVQSKELTIGVQSFRYNTKERMCQPMQSPNILSLFYYFLFFLPFLNLIWKYGREREENIIAHHWRYGYSPSKYWWSHFLCSFLHFLVLDIFVFILTVVSWETRPKTEFSDPLTLVYLAGILVLTACELIISAMVVISLVSNAVNAIYFGIILWVIIYSVFAIVLEYSSDVQSYWLIFSLVILFNNDFAYGMRYLMNLNESTAKNIGYLFAIIVGSILLKCIMLLFVQYFRPGRYVQRPTFIGFIKACCCYCGAKQPKSQVNAQLLNQDNYQFGPLHGEKYVIVSQLAKTIRKMRGPNKNVLKKINMIVFKGEITIILGPYSSGKTTFASILAGWQTPDAGSIEFLGDDIDGNKKAIRAADICMPNNALFDYLTAAETLVYFINIKGNFRRREQFNDEVQQWMSTIKPAFKVGEDKKLVRYMNFGQKRLLALCCALCCNTQIVILDEPTSHMRAAEQRMFWSILQREKADRSIILLTNSFREAETTGDRIAVLSDGTLKAYGTPMFLKTAFGTGFDLVILKDKDAPSQPITDFLQEHISDIELDTQNNYQLVYKIPSEKKPIFQMLLIQLQKRYKEFGISDTRLLTTDLSEVYLSLGRTKDQQTIPEEPQALTVDFLSKKKRVRQQWAAMFFKKFTHQPSTIIPIFMCLASVLLITILVNLLDVLRDRKNLSNAMELGFDSKHDRSLLSNLKKDCKFIGIKNIQIGNVLARERSHSFTFMSDSFFCSKNEFKTYVADSDDMGHMYGALVIDNDSTYKLYVNQHILHSAPLVLNLLHNFLLEESFQSNRKAVARIVNDPVPIPAPHATGLLDSELEHLFVPLAIGIILPITLCTFIFALVEERNNSSLMLMNIAGLRIDIYWFVNLIWDWLTFLVYSLFFQIILIVSYYNYIRLADSFLMFLIINIYSIPLLAAIYFSSMFKYASHYRAYAIACVIHITSGLFAYVIYWDVVLGQPWYLYVLLFSPTFAMLDGVSNVYVMSKFLKKCRQLCSKMESCNLDEICKSISECCEYGFFDWGNSGILRSIIFLFLTTIILILLMLWVEIHQRESRFLVTSRIKRMFTQVFPYDDPDIVKMRERIARADLRTIAKTRLVVDQVEKRIPKKSMFLSTISFDVEKKTCLGIYGTNHVGKSHLCRQIVGQESFRFGDIYIRGIPVKYNVHDSWVHLGYAPQHQGILTGFTVIEILHFFCLIRGVPKGAIPTLVSDMISLFGLNKVMRRKLSRLSKGSQRKVCVAAAMVATNKVVILDEPTKGLPQYTRREIWKALRYLRDSGKTIVFTTSDMFECDAIADAVLLIDDGEMLAYGSSHYLRMKHVGFFLEIRLRRDGLNAEDVEENLRIDVENLHRFMMFMHSDSILLNRVDNCLKFYIPVEKINFNILFGSLERNRIRLNISEYTVSQGNFEEVMKDIASKREHRKRLKF